MPAFTKGRSQLSALDVESTRGLAAVRIHVERVIGMTRQKYTMLGTTIPNTLCVADSTGLTMFYGQRKSRFTLCSKTISKGNLSMSFN